jgi:hypothetical protein
MQQNIEAREMFAAAVSGELTSDIFCVPTSGDDPWLGVNVTALWAH